MQLTPHELAVCNFVLHFTAQIGQNGNPITRVLPISQMEMGISINKKLKVSTIDGKFVDSDVDFPTEEKAFLLESIARDWNVDDGEVVIELKKKLS